MLIQDMEHVPGMTELGQRLPPEITDSPLGCLVETHTVNAGCHAATLAIARLKSALQDAAVEGVPPSGDELLALEHLTGLGKQLGILLEQAFKDVPHQATPLLRGVYFAHTQPLTSAAFPFPDTKEGQTPTPSPRPPFLTELLTHVIPSTAGLAQPLRSWFSLYATTKVMGMAAWLLALLFVCGVLGVNTVYQHHVLTAEQKHVDLLTHSQVVNDLYKQMQYARYLEHARTSWYLPTLGQDMIGIVERKAKDAFLQASFSQLLLPVLTSIRTFLIDPATAKKKNEQLDVAKELSWICEVMADRLEKGHTLDNEALPLTVFSQKTWTPLNGELVRTSLDWVEDEAQLQHFSHDLQQLLAYSLSRESGNMLRLMTDNINAFTSDSRVCLSQFWSHLPTSADADICVPTRYTVAGQTQLQDSLDDILIISGRNPVLVQEIERFLDAYYRDYAKAWQAFINKSNAVQLDVLRGDAFTPYAELKSAAQLPQILLLQRLAKELVPLIKSKNPPAWVDSLELTNTMVTLALSSNNTTATLWDTVLTLVQSSPETLSVLRKNTRDNAEMRAVLQAVPNMQTYFTQILDIAHSLASPAQALPLASMHYGTGELGDVSKSPFTEAEKHLTAALKPTPGDNPAKALLRDMLTTMKQGVTVQAARELQRRWENDVLGDPINLYRPNDTTAIYGQQGNDKEKGLVPTFVEANLKPFLKRDGSDLVAASWGTLDFPFTTDFLHSLSRAEALAVTPTRSSYT
ncbi:MAG: type VI secretion protein IcmF/TssM N-terminal domain-containing protein, partial [Bilophila sp.]